jgi:hypothetical protein
LPDAAERPCAVARTEMGKISAASRKVVQFGPNCWKKDER